MSSPHSLFQTFTHCVRYVAILVWAYLQWDRIWNDTAYARSFVYRLEAVGIMPIKLLQFVCSSMDPSCALHACVRDVCLSNVCAHSHAHTMRILQGTNVLALIQDVPLVCVGSGTIAQTYRCTLRATGAPCILKIQHPDDGRMGRDLWILRQLVWATQRWFGVTRIHVDWDGFMASYLAQQDFHQEAQNILRFGGIFNHRGSPIRVPRLYSYGPHYLLMQAMPGVHPYQLHLTPPEQKHIRLLVGAAHFYAGLFHGVVHGDPHEGNILVSPDRCSIALIDFGLVVRSRSQSRGEYSTDGSDLATHQTIVALCMARRQTDRMAILSIRQLTGRYDLQPSTEAIDHVRAYYKVYHTYPNDHVAMQRLRHGLTELGLPIDRDAVQQSVLYTSILQYVEECMDNGLVGRYTVVTILNDMYTYPFFRQRCGGERLRLLVHMLVL